MDIAALEQDLYGAVDGVEQRVKDALASHAVELQHVTAIALAVENSDLAKTALSLIHVPPGIQTAMADVLLKAEDEFARLAADTTDAPA